MGTAPSALSLQGWETGVSAHSGSMQRWWGFRNMGVSKPLKGHQKDNPRSKRTRPMHSSSCISRIKFLSCSQLFFIQPSDQSHRTSIFFSPHTNKHSQSSPGTLPTSTDNQHVFHQAYRDREAALHARFQHQHLLPVSQFLAESTLTWRHVQISPSID